MPRTLILGPFIFEEVQHMLSAFRRPKGQKAMVRICKSPTATNGDKARVARLRKNHFRLASAHPFVTIRITGTEPLCLRISRLA